MARRTSTHVVIREVFGPEDPAVASTYDLLRRSFHHTERVSLAEWKSTLAEKASEVWTDLGWHLMVALKGRRVVGLATGTYIGSVNVGIIGYLAIDPVERAGGLGTRLRHRLRRAIARDATMLTGRALGAILGEVSATNPWIRTLARRPSVLVLDFPYYQPRLHRGDDPSPFLLYYETVDGPPRTYLPASELRRVLYAVWRRGYRIARPLERPAFRAMLRALAGRRRITAVKLSDANQP